MKLQLKLALYNALIKLAIILFTGVLILVSLENITYTHIASTLKSDKDELMKHLSASEVERMINDRQSYNLLKEEYIFLRQIHYNPYRVPIEGISRQQRTIDQKTDTYLILSYKFNYSSRSYVLEIGYTIDAVTQLKHTIEKFTLLMLIVALSLSLLIDLIFTKYLFAPFYKIIDRKLIKVNDPMNFDYEKIKTTTSDFELLDGSISTLMKKITDMFLLEKQFIANVSHELLTPISIISTRLENVLVHENLGEDGENKIFASLKTLNRLKSIINSLLLISKVENNQFNKEDTIKIADVINDIYLELDDRMEARKIIFNNQIRQHYLMKGNLSLIHTLLFNIINNAIKYNHEAGSITVSDELHNNEYILEITDTGTGMDEQQIENAFNRFEKFNTDEKESHGLGLAIVKSITAFHNIKIQIRSSKNTGTTVRLQF